MQSLFELSNKGNRIIYLKSARNDTTSSDITKFTVVFTSEQTSSDQNTTQQAASSDQAFPEQPLNDQPLDQPKEKQAQLLEPIAYAATVEGGEQNKHPKKQKINVDQPDGSGM